MTKDFIVALNYGYQHGCANMKDKKIKMAAYHEFGEWADKQLGDNAPNGLNGVWWDEVKQFVEPGVIDWSWTKNIWK